MIARATKVEWGRRFEGSRLARGRVLSPSVLLVFLLVGVPAARAGDEGKVFVCASQVGYEPADLKVGMAFSDARVEDRFAVVDAGTGETVFEGKANDLAGERWGQFDHQAELDFSELKSPGRYVLRVGETASLPFEIGPRARAELPDQFLEYMRQQRCGYNPWLKVECHQEDGRTAYGPLPAGTKIDASGGWHDAGDLLKYHITSGNATAQMLLAYLLAGDSGGGLRTWWMVGETRGRMACRTCWTRRGGGWNGCSRCIRSLSRFITRWRMTGTMLGCDYRKTR